MLLWLLKIGITCSFGQFMATKPAVDPFLKSKENVWATAVIHAVGQVKLIDDLSQSPHCKSKTV